MDIIRTLGGLKGGKKINDSIVLGSLAGLIGTIVMDVSNFLIWRSNKTEALYGHLSGSMIMQSFRTHRRENFILGQILHMATGMAFGIFMVFTFKKTGRDHHLFKGGLIGSLLWSVFIDFGKRMNFFSLKPRLSKSFYSGLFNNLIFGITTAQAIVSLADCSVFPKKHIRTVSKTGVLSMQTSNIQENNQFDSVRPKNISRLRSC